MKEVRCGRYMGPFEEIPFDNYIYTVSHWFSTKVWGATD